MDDSAGRIRIEVMYSPAPRQVWVKEVLLPIGSGPVRARDALVAAGLFDDFPALSHGALHVSRWGRACEPAQQLSDGDRLEVCRPLRVDPKTARRERFASQGARTAGLFARRRSGAKPGY